MPEVFSTLALLACPVGMGAMMWMRKRGGSSSAPEQGEGSAELARTEAEVDGLRAPERDSNTTAR